MSVEQYAYTIEQDPSIPPAGNELPTYDDLAQQNGPNSRFGRWKGWIEKRAAERYADVTPEERARRRERGWGETIHDNQPTEPRLDEEILNLNLQSSYVKQSAPQDPIVNHRLHHDHDLPPIPLHIQTNNLTAKLSSPPSTDDTSTITTPQDPIVNHRPHLPPAPLHLQTNNFLVSSPSSTMDDTSTITALQDPIVNHRHHLPLHVQTNNLTAKLSSLPSTDDTITAPLFASQIVSPTHLKICYFGSRFLPHTTSQIRCILPLLADRIILIGHDDGLSVLDMFPQESAYRGELVIKGPSEAQCWPIWKGESVLQMSMLEAEDIGNGTPQGVILAVVCPSHDSPAFSKDYENIRTVRMYNLASLIGLARWTIANEGAKPIDLPKIVGQSSPSSFNKRHRPRSSIAHSIKSFIDNPSQIPSYQPYLPNSSNNSISTINSAPEKLIPLRREPDDSEWDIVDDQCIRWATDYKPLAPPGSRLAGISALLFATWSDEGRKGGDKLLAIATKSNVILYETPKGERAYKFVKEFYTPLQTRSLGFFHQTIPDSTLRHYPDTVSGRFNHKRSSSGSTLRGSSSFTTSTLNTTISYSTHLCLFVVFDKKAVWIRLADSVVGEVELSEDEEAPPATHLFSRISTASTATLRTRARLSLDIRESISRWLVPVRCELPVPGQIDTLRPVYILTRGKRTHIVPCPYPARSPPTPPLYAFFWKSSPKYVSPRVIHAKTDSIDKPPLLQLVSFSDNGIEVQESTLTFLRNKGKGRAMPDDLTKGEEDIGGDAGFLAVGGNWDQLDNLYGLETPALTGQSMDNLDSLDLMRRDQGIYGWCRKGFEDWRVFWVGGDRSQDTAQDDGFGL